MSSRLGSHHVYFAHNVRLVSLGRGAGGGAGE